MRCDGEAEQVGTYAVGAGRPVVEEPEYAALDWLDREAWAWLDRAAEKADGGGRLG